ncbi:MAG: hypothetical protein WD638_04865 [Nitriliruptoraceae bacterium]
MGVPHERYEELAVGHVLGGLSSEESAELREHLHSCRVCRSRVAELRGIADDLAAAAREERARVPVRTEEPQAVADEDHPVPSADGPGLGSLIRRGHLIAAILLTVAVAFALAFWNLHLRTAVDVYDEVVANQSDALSRLADGVELEPDLASGISGRVVTDGEYVTLTLSGVPELEEGEGLYAWFRDASCPREPPPTLLAGPGEPRDGTLASSLEINDACRLIITREGVIQPTEPRGARLVEVALVPDGR